MNNFKKTDRLYAVCQDTFKKKRKNLFFSKMKPKTHKHIFGLMFRQKIAWYTPKSPPPPPPPTFLPPSLFSCPGQRNRQRPEPVPMTGMRYNSLFWMCTLNTLTWPDLTPKLILIKYDNKHLMNFSQYFEDWSFMRDQERSSMLPMMAAGEFWLSLSTANT